MLLTKNADHQEMAEKDITKLLRNTTDNAEHQLAHQEQIGGSLAPTELGRFAFTLNQYVGRHRGTPFLFHLYQELFCCVSVLRGLEEANIFNSF